MKITREDFEHWLASPVTEAVLSVVAKNADENKELWVQRSWGGGDADPVALAALRAQARLALDLSEFEWTDLPEEMRDDDKHVGHPSD